MASSSGPSSSSSLAPFWVLEALADQTQIDPPLLKWFLSNYPNFFEESPDSVKERLALRYLEEFGIRGAFGTEFTGTIDVTKSCEEVFCTNLTKVVDLSKLVPSGNEIINQPIRQFISQKRSTLPKLSLEMVQESALKGQIPKLGSINVIEPSSNQEHECNNEIEEQEMVISPKSTDGTRISQEKPDPDNILQKGPSDNDDILQKGPSDSGMTTGEHHNAPSAENNVLAVSNLETNENAELSSDDTNNFVLQRRLPTAPNVSLKALKETILENNIPILPSTSKIGNSEQERVDLQKHPPTSENLSNYETASEEPNIIPENIPTDNVQNANPNVDPNIVPETSSDTNDPLPDPFEGEKARLLSSQFNATQDSVRMTEQSMCIKCDKSGQLLNCSNEGCVISVHETCLGGTIPNNFDKNGFFYCPFCAYSRAGRVYKKAKKDLSHARKKLSMFLGKDDKRSGTNRNNKGEESRGNDKGKNVISTEENRGRNDKGKNVIPTEENRGRNDKDKKVIITEDRDNDDNNSSTSEMQEERNTNGVQNRGRNDKDKKVISAETRGRNGKGKNIISAENRDRNDKGKKVISAGNRGGDDKGKKVISTENRGGNDKGKKVISTENRGDDKGKKVISTESRGGNDKGKKVISTENRVGNDKGKKVISTEDSDIDDSSSTSEMQEKRNINSRVEELEKYRYVKSKGPIGDANVSSESSSRNEERENNTRSEERREGGRENKRRREEESREGERENKRRMEEEKRVGQRENNIGVSNGSSESKSIDEERGNNRTREERREEERRGVQRQNKRRIVAERRVGQRENIRRTSPRYVNPVVTTSRRNTLFWSEQEVKALRDGMKKFGNPIHGRIPWREILEYRRRVFDKSRLPGDLKDKWRNMMESSTSGQT